MGWQESGTWDSRNKFTFILFPFFIDHFLIVSSLTMSYPTLSSLQPLAWQRMRIRLVLSLVGSCKLIYLLFCVPIVNFLFLYDIPFLVVPIIYWYFEFAINLLHISKDCIIFHSLFFFLSSLLAWDVSITNSITWGHFNTFLFALVLAIIHWCWYCMESFRVLLFGPQFYYHIFESSTLLHGFWYNTGHTVTKF